MPDWIGYINNDPITYRGIDISPTPIIAITETQMLEQYEEYRREQERADHIYQQEWEAQHRQAMKELEQEKQLQEDKENYPLLFRKEGIV